MSGSVRARIRLADDHALFRKGLANLLRTAPDFEVLGEAADGLDAIAKTQELRPDIILMDLRMPRLDGLEASRRIRESLPAVKIVMLSASEDEGAVIEAVTEGAQGYLLKTIDPEDLLDSLRGVLHGEAALSRRLAMKIMAEFTRRAQRRPARTGPPPAQLTACEQAVLALVADGKSNKEIATVLALAENTVKNCLKKVRAKLHLENRVQAAVYALSEEHADPIKRHRPRRGRASCAPCNIGGMSPSVVACSARAGPLRHMTLRWPAGPMGPYGRFAVPREGRPLRCVRFQTVQGLHEARTRQAKSVR